MRPHEVRGPTLPHRSEGAAPEAKPPRSPRARGGFFRFGQRYRQTGGQARVYAVFIVVKNSTAALPCSREP